MRSSTTALARTAAFALAVSVLAACGGGESTTVMPDITGQRLDVALNDVERAGIDDEPEVVGGGTFGVVDESNWTVCEQDPAPGGSVSGTPRVIVDRTCSGDEAEETVEESTAAEEPVAAAAPAAPVETEKPERPRKPKAEQPVAETFVMPPLVGMNLQLAQDTLQSLGSFILTQTDGAGLGRFQVLDANWKVCGQRPAAGKVTDIAFMVELIAVKLEEPC